MNAAELNILLCNQAEDVAKHLFPNCKIRNGEACCGDLSGAEGDSFKIRVTGAKTGYWGDFAGNEKGKTLIGLWCEVRGGDFKIAVHQAQEWLGVSDKTKDAFYGKKNDSKPIPVPTKAIALNPYGPTYAYLRDKRGISDTTIKAYRIGEGSLHGKRAVHFPYFEGEGKVMQMGKYLVPATDTEKRDIISEGQVKVLFGKHMVPAKGGDLYITEGEIDALSMYDMGFPAVSVPFGAKPDSKDGSNPNDEWIQNDWEWLDGFTRIYLCFDSDDKGQEAAKPLLKRLGVERTYLVSMPEGCKDANDVLLSERSEDLRELVESAKTVDPAELKNAECFREDVWRRFNPPSGNEPGIPFLLDVPWRIRPSELTVWTGISGHGKSEFLNHLMVHLADRGQRVCIASFEVPASKTLSNIAMQTGGQEGYGPHSRKHYDKVFDWISARVWLVDRVGRFSWKDLLVIFRYARSRYGVNQFVVDSLLRCGIAGEDYDQQKAFVDALVLFAMDTECHVHLVAHSKKMVNEMETPGKQDVKGSGDITDLSHNVVSVHRNKKKERDIEAYKLSTNGKDPGLDLLSLPDGFLTMTKQRETGEEFRARFSFIRKVKQFTGQYDTPSKAYVSWAD